MLVPLAIGSWALVGWAWLIRPAKHAFPGDQDLGRLAGRRAAVTGYRWGTLWFLVAVMAARLDQAGVPDPTPLMLFWPYWWWWLGSMILVFLPAALALCATHPPDEL